MKKEILALLLLFSFSTTTHGFLVSPFSKISNKLSQKLNPAVALQHIPRS